MAGYLPPCHVWSTRAHLRINSSLLPTMTPTIIDSLECVRQSVAVSAQKQAAEKYLTISLATATRRQNDICDVMKKHRRLAASTTETVDNVNQTGTALFELVAVASYLPTTATSHYSSIYNTFNKSNMWLVISSDGQKLTKKLVTNSLTIYF